MPEMTGIELLEKIKQFNPDIEVVIMTSFASIDTAIKAIRLGAYDYLTKPFEDLNIISTVIDRTVGKLKLEFEVKKLLHALKKKNDDIQNLYKHTTQLFNTLKFEEILQLSTRALNEMSNGAQVIFYDFDINKGRLTSKATYSGELMPSANLAARPPIQIQPELLANRMMDFDTLMQIPGLRQSLVGTLAEPNYMLLPLIINHQLQGLYSVLGAPQTTAQAGANPLFSSDTRNLVQQYIGSVSAQAEKAKLHSTVETLAIRDGLTELYNRRHFQNTLSHELERARRFGKTMSLVLFDIDHFKHYNDTNGHPAGDQLLREVAKIFRDTSRTIDIVARYGGEEFVAILLETHKGGAQIRAENIRKSIETHHFTNQEKQPLGNLTVSGGYAEFPSDGSTVEELIQAADQALYQSKKAGRNRMTAAAPASTPSKAS